MPIEPSITDIGIIAFVVVTILKNVFDFVTTMRSGKDEQEKTNTVINILEKISSTLDETLLHLKEDRVLQQKLFSLVKELHSMHDQKGEDGVPVWYFKAEVGNLIKEIKSTVELIYKEVS